MSQENVEIVKALIPPVGTDYKDVFGDDAVWAAARARFEPHFASDVEGAFIAWGQPQTEFRGLDGLREGFLDWIAPGPATTTRSRRSSRLAMIASSFSGASTDTVWTREPR
jgi:hypothetical protein